MSGLNLSDSCASVRDFFALYLYGELSFDEEERVESHLDGCGDCRKALERQREVQAALDAGIGERLQLSKRLVAVGKTRALGKRDLVLNDYLPTIEVDPQTYEVRADGRLLTCEPAKVLPLAQRYFLY